MKTIKSFILRTGFFFLVCILFFFHSCQNNEGKAKIILQSTTVPAEWDLAFLETTHDFGTIKESDGPVTAKFEFVNRSNQHVTIHEVNASCGCTVPDWTKKPVAPHAIGCINVTYNPKGRVSAFNKSVRVSTNGKPAAFSLKIKGVVEGKLKTKN